MPNQWPLLVIAAADPGNAVAEKLGMLVGFVLVFGILGLAAWRRHRSQKSKGGG
ncbi:MAG: hypothetical protein AB8G96_01660 [Phycisphaerales bacterium]